MPGGPSSSRPLPPAAGPARHGWRDLVRRRLGRRSRPAAAPRFEPLESRVMLAADLTLVMGVFNLAATRVSGDVIRVPLTLRNVGDGPGQGIVGVSLYASANATFEANTDKLIGSLPAVRYSLRVGKGQRLVGKAVVPDNAKLPAGAYFLIAVVDPTDQVDEKSETNNSVATDAKIDVASRFGTFGLREGARLRYTDADGTLTTLWLTGPGAGSVQTQNGLANLTLTGTTAASTLHVRALGGNGRVTFGTVDADASLGGIDGPAADVVGDVTIHGTLGRVALGTLTGDRLRITGSGGTLDLTAGVVSGLSVESASPIGSIRVGSWRREAGAEPSIAAPRIGSLRSGGDFDADLVLSGGGDAGMPALGRADIGGALRGSTWSITGDAGTIAAGEVADGWAANLTGDLAGFLVRGDATLDLSAANLGLVRVGGDLGNSQILAGADLGSDAALGGAGDAADHFAAGRLRAFRVGGGVAGSWIAAGLDPVNGVIGDGDDAILGGPASAIGSLVVGAELDGPTRFLAGAFPAAARVHGVRVLTADDPHFVGAP